MKTNHERDFIGYGNTPPDPCWPNDARLALVIVLNIEEGAEPSIPDGDPATETALTDGIREEVPPGTRDFVAESLFEYGRGSGSGASPNCSPNAAFHSRSMPAPRRCRAIRK